MSAHHWFVHVNGETFGPISNEIVVLMLRQSRLHFSDFAWCPNETKWRRISEYKDFAELLPQYPRVPIPSKAELDPENFQSNQADKWMQAAPPAQKTTSDKIKTPKKPKVRRFVRVPIEARFITAEYGSFEVNNISEGGLYVKSTTILLPVGTNIVFKLESASFTEIFDMSGVVVRLGSANDPPGFGVEFTKVSKEQRKILGDYVQARSTG